MPVTSREQFNMAYTLFKKMAPTMSELSAPDFHERIQSTLGFLRVHEKWKDIKLIYTGTPNYVEQESFNNYTYYLYNSGRRQTKRNSEKGNFHR